MTPFFFPVFCAAVVAAMQGLAFFQIVKQVYRTFIQIVGLTMFVKNFMKFVQNVAYFNY